MTQNDPETIPQPASTMDVPHRTPDYASAVSSSTASDAIGLGDEGLPYANLEEQRYLEQQAILFEHHKMELLPDYQGLYILFENGQVLDSDRDEAALIQRAYQTMGMRPLLVKQVLLEEPKLTLWTPIED